MPGPTGKPVGMNTIESRIIDQRSGSAVSRAFITDWLTRLVVICVAVIGWTHADVYGVELTPAQTQNNRCYNCHGQNHITDLSAAERRSMVAPPQDRSLLDREPDARPGLYIPPDALLDGLHGALACTDCHDDVQTLPHAISLGQVNCTVACHDSAAVEYRRGVHAEASASGDDRAPTCATCHGGHNIYPSTDRRANTYPLNVIKLCGDCHSEHHEATTNGYDETEYVQSYMESVHGKAVSEAGLIVAATCVDCHGGHGVRPSRDESSSVHRTQVPETCGQCHRGIEEVYAQSIHGKQLAAGDPDAPVCSDCHAAHAITQAKTPGFMRDIIGECGQCHDRMAKDDGSARSFYDTYRMSYHGQVNELGSARSARCSDCHGAHNVLPASDPVSRIHQDNIVSTCGECHKESNVKFAQFMPHADFRDWENYPLLAAVWMYFIVLMSLTFGFYGVHSVLWLIRSLIEKKRNTTGGTESHADVRGYAVKRFRKINRVNHAFVAITFFGLTLTGMPLLFSDQGWAKALARAMGGVDAAGLWHRIFAVVLVINFVVHFVGVYKRFRKKPAKMLLTGPYTLLPRWKDVTDCLGMFRWFLTGRGKPAFDRWTYWEKFDYWAEIAGTFIIGGTGLMLWFPGIVSKVIPGWSFNVATIVHGYEALLAAGFIFTIHFFNANLRPEKFPVDDVMFTGVVPEDEFRHERPEEYQRLKESGELESLRVPAPPKWARTVSIVVGVTAMAIGLSMVVLIVLAGLGLL
jgi:cytochrome b subunit of formate dehydrogenase